MNNSTIFAPTPSPALSEPAKCVTKHSPGPWSKYSTMSSDLYSVYSIFDAHDKKVGTVARPLSMELSEALANTRLLVAAPDMAATLAEVSALLSDHPEATRGNSKVHCALVKINARLAQAGVL